jgi:hypothetical protein
MFPSFLQFSGHLYSIKVPSYTLRTSSASTSPNISDPDPYYGFLAIALPPKSRITLPILRLAG